VDLCGGTKTLGLSACFVFVVRHCFVVVNINVIVHEI